MPATDPIDSGEFSALVDELRAGAPAAPERLRQRVLELVPAPRRRWSRRRRLVLVVVPAAAALAVGAALVHGFVSSGSRPQAVAAKGHTVGTLGPRATTTTVEKRAVPLKPATATTSDAVPGALLSDRLVHADASLSVRVADRAALTRATTQATRIVTALGGYAASVQYETSHQGYGSASLALRVPVGRVHAAVARLGRLGTVLEQRISTQDLQQQLARQSNRIGTLRRTISAYEQALQNPSLSDSQRVILKVKLANARKALAQMRHARSGTVSSAATAHVSLTLTTKQHAAVTPVPRGRFDRMLGSAAGFLGLEGMIVLYALVVLSPVLVLGGLGWALVRERRRRDEKRLLASA